MAFYSVPGYGSPLPYPSVRQPFPVLYPPSSVYPPVNPMTTPPTASDGYDLYLRKLLAPETLNPNGIPVDSFPQPPSQILPGAASRQAQSSGEINWVQVFGWSFAAVLAVIGGKKLWTHFFKPKA